MKTAYIRKTRSGNCLQIFCYSVLQDIVLRLCFIRRQGRHADARFGKTLNARLSMFANRWRIARRRIIMVLVMQFL